MISLYIILGILLFLIIVCLVIGNFLVSFSIDRKSKFNLESKAKKEGWNVERPDYSKETEFLQKECIVESVFSKEGYKLFSYFANSKAGKNKTDKYAILIHGYGGIPEEMVSYAKHYLELGFNCLIPVHRSHGKSDGRYIGMGTLERYDMLLWINLIIKKNPNAKILLHGVSMGGATVMMTCGLNLPENVKVAVEDCGYTTVKDIFSDKIKKMFHLSPFPLIQISSLVCKLRAGYSFTKGNSIKAVSNSKIPIAFIHGEKDGFVPVQMVDRVYNACKTEKCKLIVQGADHTKSLSENPELYWNTVDNFIKKFI